MFGYNVDTSYKPRTIRVKKLGDTKLQTRLHYVLKRTTEKASNGKTIYFAYYNIGCEIFLHGSDATVLQQQMIEELTMLMEEARNYQTSRTIQLRSVFWPLDFELEVGKTYSVQCNCGGIQCQKQPNNILVLDSYISELNVQVYDVLINGAVHEEMSWSSIDNTKWTAL